MLIGISSIQFFSGDTVDTTNKMKDFLMEHKLNYLDAFLIPPFLTGEKLREMINKMRENLSDLRITLRAPSFAENLTSILKGIREVTLEEYVETIKLAAEVGAEAVIIKPGMMFHIEKKCRDKMLDILRENLGFLADLASRNNLLLLLENYYYPYEVLRRAESFSYIYEFIKEYNNVGFALNIPHLLETRSSTDYLVKHCSKKVLSRIKLVYVGLRPSPWEKSNFIQSITHSYYEFIKLYNWVKPDYLVIASIDATVTRLLMDYIREQL